MNSNRHRPSLIALLSIVLGCGMLSIGYVLLTSVRDVGADIDVPSFPTCDDFSSWDLANQHYETLDETSAEARILDSNGNRVPCEGLIPRSQHPSEEFDVVCDDFQHRDEAEYFFETYESPGQNRYGLDRDLDGRPCEAVPPLDKINRVLSRLNRSWKAEAQDDFDKDCNDFATWTEANTFFVQEGGPESDPHRLDGNSNGIPCEALQGAPEPEID